MGTNLGIIPFRYQRKTVFYVKQHMIFLFVCLFVLWYWGLKSVRVEQLHQPFFVKGFFKIGSHGTFCLGWLQNAILLISAS
jgi:hypothetical protein